MWLLPPSHRRPAGAFVAGRTQATDELRATGQALHLAHQHDRPEHAPKQPKARGEVGDFDHAALPVEETGDEERRMVEVGLLRTLEFGDLDTE